MRPPNAEDIIDYIIKSMCSRANDLDLLKKDLDKVLSSESTRGSPELQRILSAYILTINGYASTLSNVCKMLGEMKCSHELLTDSDVFSVKQ